VPETLPVTEETRERLRDQANQLGEATVLRLIDLLAVAVEDLRQGGDPRLPLELALVKVTRPAADLSRESIAFRLEQLEAAKPPVRDSGPVEGARGNREVPPTTAPSAEPPSVELEQLQEAWQRTILPAVEGKSIPAASMLREAHPAELTEDTLTLAFPPSAGFHRRMAEDPKNARVLRETLYEVTGRRLALAFAEGENGHEEEEEERPASEDDFLALVKETFDARDVEEDR
jgi:DNA polymerase-3 subunit gamma/tau